MERQMILIVYRKRDTYKISSVSKAESVCGDKEPDKYVKLYNRHCYSDYAEVAIASELEEFLYKKRKVSMCDFEVKMEPLKDSIDRLNSFYNRLTDEIHREG